uniref:Uncharacterized protein n=1 Tax=Dactylella sp. TaxID=1814903 RepID=A0A482DVL9_9PEZI|nr:hypothetical protein [Dactylella sp.]
MKYTINIFIPYLVGDSAKVSVLHSHHYLLKFCTNYGKIKIIGFSTFHNLFPVDDNNELNLQDIKFSISDTIYDILSAFPDCLEANPKYPLNIGYSVVSSGGDYSFTA